MKDSKVLVGPVKNPENIENTEFTIFERADGARILRMEVNLDEEQGDSSSGKSIRIASTHGPFSIEQGTTVSLNVNKSKRVRRATLMQSA